MVLSWEAREVLLSLAEACPTPPLAGSLLTRPVCSVEREALDTAGVG